MREDQVTLHPVDKLSTPTEEQYSKNRFNPFDNAPEESAPQEIPAEQDEPASPGVSRQTLEDFLKHTLTAVACSQKEPEEDEKITVVSPEPEEIPALQDLQEPEIQSFNGSEPSCESPGRSSVDFGTLLQLRLGFQSDDSRPSSRQTDEIPADFDEQGDSWHLCRGSDIWNDTLHSHNILCVAASGRYVCCVDSNKILKYSLLNLPSFVWQESADKADLVCVSPNGGIVWRLLNGTAYGLLKPHRNAPKGVKWVEAAHNVVTAAVTDRTAWYLRQNGEVVAYCT